MCAAVRTAPGLPAPDIQIFLIDAPFHPPWLAGPQAGYTIAFTTLHPYSRGRAEEALPGPDVQDPDELRDYLRRDTDSYHHSAGTCRMGTDPAAVVDSQLRVHGIDRLRVADASVMLSLPGANTHAAVLAVAERAATLLG